MKRLSFIVIILSCALVLFGFTKSRDVDYVEAKTHTEFLDYEQNQYNGEEFIKSRLFENESVDILNQNLYDIMNSQQAILTLMDDCGVKDDVFVQKRVKEGINYYYNKMLEAYDNLQYGVNNERFDILTDKIPALYNEASQLDLDYGSKQSKRYFYGTIYQHLDTMLELVNLYNE